MFDWPEISVWYFNWQVKLTCKVSDSKSMSKFVFYTTCTVKIQCFYTLWRNRPQFHTRACFYMFDWPEISVWYFNWQVKLTCKVSDSKSMSKFIFYTTCTVKIQCFYTLWRNRPQFHTRAYFYTFDWPEISVWYFNWQVKLTCKVSDCKSMSKFVFYTTCTVKIQCFHTPITKSTPISHTRILLYVRWPEISVWYFNWQVKLTCKVSDCKSMSKFVFYTTCTVKIQCFHTPITKSTPISTRAYFYMFDDLKFQYDTSIGKLNWRAKFQTVNRCRSLSFTLHVPSKYSVSTPYDEIDPNFTHAHASICSTDLKFQYDTSIGKLNWRAKFQTVNRCRSLSFTLHVPSKYSVSTPYDEIDPNFTHAHTSRRSTDLKFQYDTSIGKLNWRAKFQTVNRCRSLSFTLHAQSKYSVSTPLSRNRPQFHTRAYFYLFDWPEISVWYFNWQDKLTCKVSGSKSMSKFIFYTTCTVKIQCFYTLSRNRPQFHTRACFYIFSNPMTIDVDWPEISVWYFNSQIKLTCKVSRNRVNRCRSLSFTLNVPSKYSVSTPYDVWYFKSTSKFQTVNTMSKYVFFHYTRMLPSK